MTIVFSGQVYSVSPDLTETLATLLHRASRPITTYSEMSP